MKGLIACIGVIFEVVVDRRRCCIVWVIVGADPTGWGTRGLAHWRGIAPSFCDGFGGGALVAASPWMVEAPAPTGVSAPAPLSKKGSIPKAACFLAS